MPQIAAQIAGMVYPTFTATCPDCLKEVHTTEPDLAEHRKECRRRAESRAATSYTLGSHGWNADRAIKRGRRMSCDEASGKIALRLRKAREGAGLSQSEAATMLGVHRVSVTNMENGRRQCSAAELARLCVTYRVSADWVLGLEGER